MLDHGDMVDVLANALDRFKSEEMVISQIRTELNSLKKDFGVNELLIDPIIRWIDVLEQLNYGNSEYHNKEMIEEEKKWELQKKNK